MRESRRSYAARLVPPDAHRLSRISPFGIILTKQFNGYPFANGMQFWEVDRMAIMSPFVPVGSLESDLHREVTRGKDGKDDVVLFCIPRM